jgi:tripartite-type tricarboxylate transporter receptor subunit TctC
VKTILEKPEVQKKAAELASTPAPMTPKQFAEYIQAERQKWSEVVKAVGIQLGQ